jgi:hypothetical protein
MNRLSYQLAICQYREARSDKSGSIGVGLGPSNSALTSSIRFWIASLAGRFAPLAFAAIAGRSHPPQPAGTSTVPLGAWPNRTSSRNCISTMNVAFSVAVQPFQSAQSRSSRVGSRGLPSGGGCHPRSIAASR